MARRGKKAVSPQVGERLVERRVLPITCTLKPDQLDYIQRVTQGNPGERSRWIRDAIDRKIYDEKQLLKGHK